MKKTTITKEYREDGTVMRETTVIEESGDTEAPILTPWVPHTPYYPTKGPDVTWGTTTVSGGHGRLRP